MLLSIVIPCFNEQENISLLYEKLRDVVKGMHVDYEMIFINDGSNDQTLEVLKKIANSEQHINILDLSRNFGKEIALSAGLDFAKGDLVLTMDSDFQHPPELIPEFLQQIENGYDVVYGQRINRSKVDSMGHNILVRLFYKIMHFCGEVPIPENGGDFRLMKRQVVDALTSLPEKKRFMKGLYAWVGFNQKALPFQAPQRHSGKSKWNKLSLFGLAINGIVSFSSLPLRFWSWTGLIIAGISALYSLFIIIQTLIFGIDIPGYATLAAAIFFLSGIQLISIGVLGEYISRIFNEVKNRPQYIVKKVYNASKTEDA